MTPDEQLALWVQGDARCPNDRNECCPDFGCCRPRLLRPRKLRERFAAADQATREGMMVGALVGLADSPPFASTDEALGFFGNYLDNVFLLEMISGQILACASL